MTEAFNKDEEEYEEKRLVESLLDKNNLSAEDLVKCVIDNVQTFTKGIDQSDDITCLALKYLKQ